MDARGIFVIIFTLITIGLSFFLAWHISNKGKKSSDVSDWNIGGRDLPLYVIVGTQFASAMGGGVIVGQVGNAYDNGIAMILYGLFASLPFIAFILIGRWIREMEFETIPDMLGYLSNGNKRIKIIAAVLTIIVPFGWLISQMVAFAKMYTQITGISLNVLIVVMAIASLLFVMPAGMKTVAWTDFFFACIMGVVCICVVMYCVNDGASIGTIKETLPKELIEVPNGLLNVGWTTIILWFISCLPGGMTNQMYFQRVCALKDAKKVNKSLIISGIALLVAFTWSCYMGNAIHVMNPNLEGENATGWLLTIMPMWLIGLFAALITSTIMSTISSATQSIVVNLTHDIYKTFYPNAENRKLLNISRMLSVIILAISALLGIKKPEVLNWVVNTYSYSAAGLCVPMYVGYAMFKRGLVTPAGLTASMVMGIAGCIIAQVVNTTVPFVVYGIVASLIAIFVVSAITKGNDKSIKRINS